MSDVRELCRKTYREYIETQPIPTELRRALRTHERVPNFIDNLSREIHKVHTGVKRETIIKMVEDMTKFFVIAVTQSAEEKAMSPIKKAMILARKAEADQFRKDAEQLERLGTNHVIETEKGEIHKSQTAVN